MSVWVAVLIINIHKSRAVTFYLIKHRILMRGDFIDIKSLHVMYYRPFDRSMGLWIIDKFYQDQSSNLLFCSSICCCRNFCCSSSNSRRLSLSSAVALLCLSFSSSSSLCNSCIFLLTSSSCFLCSSSSSCFSSSKDLLSSAGSRGDAPLDEGAVLPLALGLRLPLLLLRPWLLARLLLLEWLLARLLARLLAWLRGDSSPLFLSNGPKKVR